ncbi:MAG TPA: hypothetical protein VLF71_06060 [Candidatus Saccharimonadales bacterium]|nr:hypothetical protein [Candidatus Saccharimonadales bacterium]
MFGFLTTPLHLFAAVSCQEREFFGLPTWYHYLLAAQRFQVNAQTGHCELITFTQGFKTTDVALISLAIVDILLRISVYITIGYIMYGGFRLITAQGDPQGTKAAQQTIWNALIGLGIALAAVGAVAFIGRAIT